MKVIAHCDYRRKQQGGTEQNRKSRENVIQGQQYMDVCQMPVIDAHNYNKQERGQPLHKD